MLRLCVYYVLNSMYLPYGTDVQAPNCNNNKSMYPNECRYKFYTTRAFRSLPQCPSNTYFCHIFDTILVNLCACDCASVRAYVCVGGGVGACTYVFARVCACERVFVHVNVFMTVSVYLVQINILLFSTNTLAVHFKQMFCACRNPSLLSL